LLWVATLIASLPGGFLMIRMPICALPMLLILGHIPEDSKAVPAGSAKVLAGGLAFPGAVTANEDGVIYFASQQGGLHVVREGKGQSLALEEKQVQQVVAWKKVLFACDHHEFFRVTPQGEVKTVVGEQGFTDLVGEPITLGGFALDERGQAFVAGNTAGGLGVLFKIHPSGKPTVVITPGKIPVLTALSGVASAGETAVMVQRSNSANALLLCTQTQRLIAEVPFCAGNALDYDSFGRLYGVDKKFQRVGVLPRPGMQVQTVSQPFKKLGGLSVDHPRHRLLAADAEEGTILSLPLGDPAHPLDETPLPFTVEPAFPKIKWAGWEAVNENGIPAPHRPLILTHANDQSHRTFVASQQGVIYVFPNKPDVQETKVFLDLQKKVTYSDQTNEEGYLGLAFHPKYKETGEFFVFYSPNNGKHPSLETVISRFKVSKHDPDKADPDSEEVLFRFKRPFWNHDGGTLCFGPDGYLYICLGDGGAANDPYDNGQKPGTLLASILRIDVDHRDQGKGYAVPKDNPLVGVTGAAPEKFVWGVRNAWRMSFDRQTGQGWFADVGQNLYEEINLLQKGANYGWNRRESYHPFGPKAQDVNAEMVEPIWEYHHRVGKSITGGHVYRGKQLPELNGYYLFADYVSGKIWGLKFDFEQKQVTAHREIAGKNLPIMSFGEDEDGEAYLMTFSASGQGIDRVVRKK
jgi:glucose/arabinose dehydrogenase